MPSTSSLLPGECWAERSAFVPHPGPRCGQGRLGSLGPPCSYPNRLGSVRGADPTAPASLCWPSKSAQRGQGSRKVLGPRSGLTPLSASLSCPSQRSPHPAVFTPPSPIHESQATEQACHPLDSPLSRPSSGPHPGDGQALCPTGELLRGVSSFSFSSDHVPSLPSFPPHVLLPLLSASLPLSPNSDCRVKVWNYVPGLTPCLPRRVLAIKGRATTLP